MRDNASNAALSDAFFFGVFFVWLPLCDTPEPPRLSSQALSASLPSPPLPSYVWSITNGPHNNFKPRWHNEATPAYKSSFGLPCALPLYSDVEVVGNEGPRGLGDARLLSCRSPLFMLMAASRPVQNAGLTRYDRFPSYALRCIHSSQVRL